MTFNFDALKDILVCPRTHAPLVLDGSRLVSTDPETRLSYSVRDDIPIMLVDEAVEVPEEEWRELMRRNHRDPDTGRAVEQTTN